jgi:hypothetical protein
MVRIRVEIGLEEAAHIEVEVAWCTVTGRVVAGVHNMASMPVEAGLVETGEHTELEVEEEHSLGKVLRPKAQHARRTLEHDTSSDR